jgi:hypothetical protein
MNLALYHDTLPRAAAPGLRRVARDPLTRELAKVGVDAQTMERDAQCDWGNADVDRYHVHREGGDNDST